MLRIYPASIFVAAALAVSTSALAQEERLTLPPPAAPSETTIQPYDSEGRPNPDAFEWTGFALGLKFGTLGIGADATIYLDDWVNFRGNVGWLDFSYKDTIDDIDFDMDVDFRTAMLLLDFYPFEAGNFRISGGVVFQDNTLTVDGTIESDESIGDNTYTPEEAGTITGDAEFDEVAPYIGIGYGNAVLPDGSLTFIVDFGVLFQTYDITITSDGTAANDPAFQADLKELEEDIEKELNRFKIYPVINFGIAYHF